MFSARKTRTVCRRSSHYLSVLYHSYSLTVGDEGESDDEEGKKDDEREHERDGSELNIHLLRLNANVPQMLEGVASDL